MNINELFDALVQSEDLKGIPVIHVLRVLATVFELINSGKFFYENEQEI